LFEVVTTLEDPFVQELHEWLALSVKQIASYTNEVAGRYVSASYHTVQCKINTYSTLLQYNITVGGMLACAQSFKMPEAILI
jgi:hypothetical protein